MAAVALGLRWDSDSDPRRVAQAESLLLRALDVIARHLSMQDYQMSLHGALQSLGEMYRGQGRVKEAEVMERRSLKLGRAADAAEGIASRKSKTVFSDVAAAALKGGLSKDELLRLSQRLQAVVMELTRKLDSALRSGKGTLRERMLEMIGLVEPIIDVRLCRSAMSHALCGWHSAFCRAAHCGRQPRAARSAGARCGDQRAPRVGQLPGPGCLVAVPRAQSAPHAHAVSAPAGQHPPPHLLPHRLPGCCRQAQRSRRAGSGWFLRLGCVCAR